MKKSIVYLGSLCLAVSFSASTLYGQRVLPGEKKVRTEEKQTSPAVVLSQDLENVDVPKGSVAAQIDYWIKTGVLSKKDAQYVVLSDHVSRTSRIHHYYLQQAIDNLGVSGTESSIHIASDGTIVQTNNEFLQHIDQMITSRSVALTAEQAVASVASAMRYPQSSLEVVSKSSNPNQKVVFDGGAISAIDIPVELRYYYKEGVGVTKIWELSIQEKTSSDWFNFRVDASTGVIINKDNWTVSCNILGNHEDHIHTKPSTFEAECIDTTATKSFTTVLTESEALIPTYQVFALPLRSPYAGGRTNVVSPENAIASPLGWHDDGSNTFTRTQGNNVRCYDDDNTTNSPSNINDYADGGAGLVFQFPLETVNGAGEPVYSSDSQSEDAAVSHLFYLSNVIHDIIFQFGMDEAGGAFQEDNFGNGGVGGDSVNAEAQDGSGTCNANFGTPSDGGNPRMQMYTCGNRDASFDNEVVIHEYGHGISNRLTGGPGAAGCLQNGEQMGEGWSDYYGLMFTMVSTENDVDARGMGNWLGGNGINGGGIRTYPYSTNFGTNPHTYDDIKTEVAPHGVGSVWAMMLWEMTWGIMNKYETDTGNGFDADLYSFTGNAAIDAGNIQALAIVTEGLKLQACSPGFVDGRDAILLADQNIYGGANQCEIWEAFARRGLGFGATQGSTADKSDGTEAFDLPPTFAAFSNSLTDVCITEGVQNNVAGGLPIGGSYSGLGVTDNGNGTNYNFDPEVSGVGTHTVTYTVTDGCTGLIVNIDEDIIVTDGNPFLVCEDYTLQLDASGNGVLDWPSVVSNEIQSDYIVTTGALGLETLTGAATTLSLGDDAVTGAIPIGFNFDMYGDTVSDFYVCSNGFIYFTPNPAMTGAQSRTAQTLPDATVPNGIIALFMDDLDPSAGGTIRYQVFGSAPNRKLVVEFDDVPYWDTTDLNSGQIHIYETVNLVEIHVAVATDGGDKTLGIESIAGDAGTTHPMTNNSGWTVASPGLTISFTPQAPSFADNCDNAVSFTLSNTNFTCLDVGDNEVTVTADDGNGGVSTCITTVTVIPNPAQLTTYNGGWSNGMPTATSVATFDGDYNTATANVEACSCIVNSAATVTVGANEYLNIRGNITVDGTLLIEHQGSIVQEDPAATVTKNPVTGIINVNVTTPIMEQRAFLLMGSPMDTETRNGVFVNAFLVLDHAPNNFNPNTHPNIPQGATNFLDLEGDLWTTYTGAINPGEGYIVRPQTGYGDPAGVTYDMTYSAGTLNNGLVSRPMIYNNTNSPAGTPNAYANPYPSAINGDQFIQDNGLSELFFWEHLTPPSVIIPGEGLKFDMDDISIRNYGGGVAANNDNPVNIPSNVISTGQGFAVKALVSGTVNFTNDMRLTTGNTTLRSNEEEVDRLWLHIESDEYELANNILIGFNPLATAGIDAGYDTDRLACSVSIYSQLESGDARFSIQTREAFSHDMKIPVGFSTLLKDEASYTISLSNYEGANLVDRAIYLFDNELNILTDLTLENYTFKSGFSAQDRRFTVVFEYDEEVLGTNERSLENIAVFPNPTDGTLNIVSTSAELETLKVYDVLGREIAKQDVANAQGYQLDMSGFKAAIYFVEIITPQGTSIKRIVKK